MIKNSNSSYTIKYKAHIRCRFACKVVCIDYRFSMPVVLCRMKNAFNKFIEAILKKNEYCKKR